MEEVYNMIVRPEDGFMTWHGIRYPLEKTIRAGSQKIYSYLKPGFPRVLVIPHFAIQFQEVKKKVHLFDQPVTLPAKERAMYKFFTLKKVEKSVFEDEDGRIIVYGCLYKDIRVTFQFDGKHLKLLPDFTIMNHNLFGNEISVPEIVEME